MFFGNRWMNKQYVVNPHSRLSLSNKKDWTIDIHDNMNKSQKSLCLVKIDRLKSSYRMFPLVWNSRKYGLIYSKRKHYQWLLGSQGGGRHWLQISKRKFLEGTEMFSMSTMMVVLQVYTPVKLIKLYIINGCKLLYVNYASIKLIRKWESRSWVTEHFLFKI